MGTRKPFKGSWGSRGESGTILERATTGEGRGRAARSSGGREAGAISRPPSKGREAGISRWPGAARTNQCVPKSLKGVPSTTAQ